MIPPIERPLSVAEQRELSARLSNAHRESSTAVLKTGAVAGGICAVLAILTLLASDAPAVVVILFWVAVWLVLTIWIGLPARRLMRGQVRLLEDALRTNRARELRLQSTRVVEFEEEEDEGACYAFALGPDSVVFIVGQEFYEDDDFPNSDFSLTEILGTSGHPIDVLLTKRGRKLHPERVIPAAVKHRLELPEHLAVVSGSVDRIEDVIARLREA